MDGDDAGSMDFMEGIIATMAVAIVLTAFLGLVAGTAVTGSDPLDDMDPGELTAEIRKGEFVPLFEDYIAGYADTHGLKGISVSTEIPGGFCGKHDPVTFGDVSDPTRSGDSPPWWRPMTEGASSPSMRWPHAHE